MFAKQLVVVVVTFFCVSCDLSDPRLPTEIPGDHLSTVWSVETGGSSNYAVYATKEVLPKGTKIRILISSKGDTADVCLIQWRDPGSTILQRFSPTTISNGQVEEIELDVPVRVGIEIQGGNFWYEPRGSFDQQESSTLRFEKNWVIDVKIIRKEF